MKQISIFLIAILTINLCNIQIAQAHGGGTDSSGCHNDNTNGGRHCHNDGDDDDTEGNSTLGEFLLYSSLVILVGLGIWKLEELVTFSSEEPDEARIQPYLHVTNDGIDNEIETGIEFKF